MITKRNKNQSKLANWIYVGHIEIFEIVVHTQVIKSVDRVRISLSNGNGTAGMCAWIADNYLFVGNKSWMLHSHLLWDLPGEILVVQMY